MRLAMIPEVLLLALRQLTDPRFLKVLVLSLAVTLVLTGPFLAVAWVLAWLIELIVPASVNLPWIGETAVLGGAAVGLVSKTSWVFWTYIMAPVAMAVIGLFLEAIVEAVEARHYPGLAPVRRQGFAGALGYAIRFFFMMLGVSALALLVSFFSGLFAPMVWIAANGYLIAREYFETVARRRIDDAAAAAAFRADLPTAWALGAALALALSFPFVNLIVPIVGVAALTHLYHRTRP